MVIHCDSCYSICVGDNYCTHCGKAVVDIEWEEVALDSEEYDRREQLRKQRYPWYFGLAPMPDEPTGWIHCDNCYALCYQHDKYCGWCRQPICEIKWEPTPDTAEGWQEFLRRERMGKHKTDHN